ncbi:MAG: hypothetical protein LC804_23385 [Acidobacteria bacterium]|nr:hypothetical protein [Acidobacteriota bacterium]
MTSTVNDLTARLLSSTDHEALSVRVDVIVIALLTVLLVEHELLRAYLGPRVRLRLHPLAVASAPLLVAFGLIVVVRSVGVR